MEIFEIKKIGNIYRINGVSFKAEIGDDEQKYLDNGGVIIPEFTDDELLSFSIPQSITPRQARIILLRNGLLDNVEEAVKTNREFEIYWEYSLEVNRNDAVLIQMSEALGISSEMLDGMFIDGSKL